MTVPRPDAAHYASRSASNELLGVMCPTAPSLALRLLGFSLRWWIVPKAKAHKDFLGDNVPRLLELVVLQNSGANKCINREVSNLLTPALRVVAVHDA